MQSRSCRDRALLRSRLESAPAASSLRETTFAAAARAPIRVAAGETTLVVPGRRSPP